MTERELNEYFKAPKNAEKGWFRLDSNNEKQWNESKVTEFWEFIKTYKLMKMDFDFSKFIFPEFISNCFYLESLEKEVAIDDNPLLKMISKGIYFNKKVIFSNAVFEGNADFKLSVFKDGIDVTDATFKEKVNFQSSLFLGSTTYFRNNVFYKESNFSIINFNEDIIFNRNTFNSDVTFRRTHFHGDSTEVRSNKFHKNANFSLSEYDKVELISNEFFSNVSFIRCRFFGVVNFQDSKFFKKCTFLSTRFNKNVSFLFSEFNSDVDFTEITINDGIYFKSGFKGKALFKNINPQKKTIPSMKFDNVIFDENFAFTYTNLYDLELINCDISYAKITRCNWNIINRLLLKNENDLLDSENHYRQLKFNFGNEKNWELSNYAYASEMEMRKRRLLKEKKYASWFVYWIYDFLSGYTINFLKPMSLLILLILLFTVAYSDWCFFQSNCNWSWLPLKISIENSFPLLKSTTPNINWGVRYFHIFISGLLIAFSILALRKRFKQ